MPFLLHQSLFLLLSAACCVRVFGPPKAALCVRFGSDCRLWHILSGTQIFHSGYTVTGGVKLVFVHVFVRVCVFVYLGRH